MQIQSINNQNNSSTFRANIIVKNKKIMEHVKNCSNPETSMKILDRFKAFMPEKTIELDAENAGTLMLFKAKNTGNNELFELRTCYSSEGNGFYDFLEILMDTGSDKINEFWKAGKNDLANHSVFVQNTVEGLLMKIQKGLKTITENQKVIHVGNREAAPHIGDFYSNKNSLIRDAYEKDVKIIS